jgi:gliding motility-associated-like protein
MLTKIVKSSFFLCISFFLSLTSKAQCFEIESILVDACGAPEGENEMVRFKVGNNELCTDDLTVTWANINNNWLGITQNGTTAQATANLNATIIGCGFLLEPTSCVLPANATVILVTSTAIDVTANSFANLSDTLYIIYQTAGNTSGHFANYNATPGLRTLTMSFSNPIGCTDVVTYERNDLININGTTGGSTADKNGATANFTAAGAVSYSNTGCQAPFDPFEIDLAAAEVISGTQSICPGDIIQVGVNIVGNYEEITWVGLNGNFNAQDVTNTTYNSDLTDNVDFYIYVNVETTCGDILSDSILFTVNQSATVNAAGPFTTFGGTQTMTASIGGGTWSAACGACINATTGVFNPAVSGEGTFQICYDAGCGQDCISVLVDDDCSMSWSITSSSPTCFGSNDGDVSINISGALGTTSYLITDALIGGDQLNSNSSSSTANNLIQGWYYFSVTDDLCTVVDSIFLDDPEDLVIEYTIINPNCYGIADGIAYLDTVLNHAGTYADVSFQWSQGVFGTNVDDNDTIFNLGANDYFLNVTDVNNCTQQIEFEIVYPDSIYFTELSFDSTICRNLVPFDNGNGQVYAAVSGGNNANGQGTNYTYLWTELLTGDVTSASTWGNRNPGDYMIVATNDLGCSITETITIDSLSPEAIFTLTSNDFTSSYEGTAVVDIELTNQSINYDFSNDPNVEPKFIWSFGLVDGETYVSSDILEINTESYLEEGEYEICLVVVETLNGCTDTTCQSIIVHDVPNLEIPNVFTPNGDNVNDEFYFPASAISEFKSVVYDRWGKVVFEFNSISDKWSGTNYKNDNLCSDGVYFYTYSGTSTNGKVYSGQGNVHLIRN